jgi:hypothetical protein
MLHRLVMADDAKGIEKLAAIRPTGDGSSTIYTLNPKPETLKIWMHLQFLTSKFVLLPNAELLSSPFYFSWY